MERNINTDGIFHPDSEAVFASLNAYAKWYSKKPACTRRVGLLTHYQNWKKKNLAVEKALIRELEAQGIGVIPVFSNMTTDQEAGGRDFGMIIRDYFSAGKKLAIDGLINLQSLGATGNNQPGDLFSQSVDTFKAMNIPVFKPIISRLQDEAQWRGNSAGLSTEMSWSFTNNEMMGMIEPVIIGARSDPEDMVKAEPIPERISRLVGRIRKRLMLAATDNKDKKIVLMLHCSPCAGVEATLGVGVGLDVFESVARMLKSLKNEGYTVENPPADGPALKKMMLDKKAYQDFRWTTVENIVAAGGDIYRMPMEGDGGYLQFYDALDPMLREQMENAWGLPPGEGMVLENELIITGLNFGNIWVMLQPKRGCYGPKCTGEVCKILHDPSCPPPHQYLATYRYIDAVINAHAIVHVGTGGSLEHLPGKINALSGFCWPDVVIGNLPNFYCYNASIGVEGMGPKRRNYATILDYLPSCIGTDYQRVRLIKRLATYLAAVDARSNQAVMLRNGIEKEITAIPVYLQIVAKEADFDTGIRELKNRLTQSISQSWEQELHIFGQLPDLKNQISYIRESLDGSSLTASLLKKDYADEDAYHAAMLSLIARVLEENQDEGFESEALYGMEAAVLVNEIEAVQQSLRSAENEMKSLVKALNGDYIEPGLAGNPRDGLERVMPTGRNFFLLDTQKIPTRESYAVGTEMANQLIDHYRQEEGKLPEKVVVNMTSTDISMTSGEQLAQILSLLGVRPVWNDSGIVMDIEAIPPAVLKRPRIDVVVRISGVLRDAYPDIIAMMDQAVQMTAALVEPCEQNFVRKNTLKIIDAISINEDLTDSEAFRRSTIRIFGDKPGAYGSGVDLALKASAWESEAELAKIFTMFSGYAYGEGLNGAEYKKEFVENIRSSEVAFETSSDNRFNILSSSFSATVFGGFRMVKNQLTDDELKQYHGNSNHKKKVVVSKTADEIKRIMTQTFFNPLWNASVMKKGYTGAAELMRKMQTLFEWKCVTENIADTAIDQVVETYLGDEEMIRWFKDNNAFAIEEITRRFLELQSRKRWNPGEEALKVLQKSYMEIEGDMEEMMEKSEGDYQGGSIEIVRHQDVAAWNASIQELDCLFKK
ncbi:cobaltochelatase subunit CobN [Acetobacterium fimetarium]|uniref:cobaltochelatase subunit CobN n=1 Tax=Acetobacterium fimetarium TaxID=52691 RepID=UPI00164C1B88|nr:cobaltochelatase subunit CobN [Acetobacterium fimetarium]